VERNQEIYLIKNTIEDLGEFMLEIDEISLKLYAYK
jgi:hypothetical protein